MYGAHVPQIEWEDQLLHVPNEAMHSKLVQGNRNVNDTSSASWQTHSPTLHSQHQLLSGRGCVGVFVVGLGDLVLRARAGAGAGAGV
jgi:hypothetical protein